MNMSTKLIEGCNTFLHGMKKQFEILLNDRITVPVRRPFRWNVAAIYYSNFEWHVSHDFAVIKALVG